VYSLVGAGKGHREEDASMRKRAATAFNTAARRQQDKRVCRRGTTARSRGQGKKLVLERHSEKQR